MASMRDKLAQYLDLARAKGLDYETIFLLLRSEGWKEKEIAEAVSTRELGLAVPQRSGVGSASDAFFHLLAFTALYAWAISLIFLLFAYVDFASPDPAMRTSTYAIEYILSGIRASLATILVAYPAFVLVWGYLLREIRRAPEKAKSPIRRWLAFLSLFVGAVVILADVITVVYYLVEGDLTTRFVLKVLVLLLVTGWIFGYLSLTLRSEGEAQA